MNENIKLQYFRQKLSFHIGRLIERQREIAVERMAATDANDRAMGRRQRSRTGELMAALSSARQSVSESGKGLSVMTQIPVYMRFLDLKDKGNWQIYNRQVWGYLYSEARNDIRFGYRDWVRDNVSALLQSHN